MKQDNAQKTTPHAIHRGRFRCPPAYDKINDSKICDISLPLRIMPKICEEVRNGMMERWNDVSSTTELFWS